MQSLSSVWTGDDANLLSDGCIRVLTLNDLTAETTGGIFDATGKRYWVSVQHNVTGHGVVLEVTGWGYASRRSHGGWDN